MINSLPLKYGDGWMSKNAQDMVRILVAFENFDPKLLHAVIYRYRNGGATINTATVQRAVAYLRDGK